MNDGAFKDQQIVQRAFIKGDESLFLTRTDAYNSVYLATASQLRKNQCSAPVAVPASRFSSPRT